MAGIDDLVTMWALFAIIIRSGRISIVSDREVSKLTRYRESVSKTENPDEGKTW